MKKAIFWDSDGTLLQGNESFKCSLMKALADAGYPSEEETVRALMRRICTWHTPERDHSAQSGEEWWQELLGQIGDFCSQQGVAPADVPGICAAFRQNVIGYDYRAYPDAQTVLQAFCSRGYENYVISNNFPELDRAFRRLGLDAFISGYILSASAGYEKPKKEIYAHALRLAGDPEICYMIGDDPAADYQGGLAAGLTPILVHNRADGAVCVGSLMELLQMIKD